MFQPPKTKRNKGGTTHNTKLLTDLGWVGRENIWFSFKDALVLGRKAMTVNHQNQHYTYDEVEICTKPPLV